MKRYEKIGITVILLVALIIYGIFLLGQSEGSMAIVTIEDAVYGRYELNTDQIIEIDKGNTLEIKDGVADMIEATCPDKLCVHQKSISDSGETIICLPHKVVVSIEGENESEVDVIAQ